MKLYYIPGACSRAANIMLREAGIEPELVLVDPATKKTSDGGDYLDINPLGYVPALQLDDGTILTENAAILQWIADTYGPKPGSDIERVKLVQELSFISSELHKAFSPFFAAVAPEGEARDALIAKLRTRIGHYEANYLKEDRGFGVAQAYAFVVLGWAGYQKIDISDFTAVAPFLAKIGERPSVKAAIEAEMALVPA